MTKYITRFAPSPTGVLHIGGARTGYFNWLAARASGGQFILRMDDTDKERSNDDYVFNILETMSWLGLNHDHLLFQSANTDRYLDLAEKMLKQGTAIRLDDGAVIFTTKNQMMRESWTDEIVGNISITDTDLTNMEGMVLVRSNGTPTYNFASVIDDIDSKVNFVIRGHDHTTNTAKQVALYDVFGYELPKFAHVGLIHYHKKKLSKRDGPASMLYYREKGYDCDAMLNFMLRLGWAPTVDDKTTKMIDRDRALELFLDGGKMRAAPANMDINMLESFDRKYKAKKGVLRNKDKLVTDGDKNDSNTLHKQTGYT